MSAFSGAGELECVRFLCVCISTSEIPSACVCRELGTDDSAVRQEDGGKSLMEDGGGRPAVAENTETPHTEDTHSSTTSPLTFHRG